ncbi:MAG: hypothetical protein B6241_10445 [Spirochaetaceae bacterium 4572_59]|nr:MAG: hypothetical protein B6241_10445 [Spirochaetaceae bacterium 4572_59]
MKKLLLIAISLVLFSTSLFAVRITPFQVDIPEAQKEIETLTQNDNDMDTENATMQSEIDTLETEITDMEALKREITITMGKVKKHAGELYSLFQNVNDVELKSKLNGQISENRKQRYALEKKADELSGLILDNEKEIELNTRYISANNVQIDKNTYRIDVLEACIKYTENESVSLESTVAQSQTLQSEVDSLVGQNPAAAK